MHELRALGGWKCDKPFERALSLSNAALGKAIKCD